MSQLVALPEAPRARLDKLVRRGALSDPGIRPAGLLRAPALAPGKACDDSA